MTVNTTTDAGGYTGTGAGTTGDLRYCINYLNTQALGTHAINFTVNGTIALNGMLPVLNLFQGSTLTIDGGNQIVIDGGNQYRGFLARQGAVTIQNITIQNCTAVGGNGGSIAGGGGLGAGAAVFSDAANIIINNVTITNCTAQGGTGGAGSVSIGGGGGGGGLGGNGGAGYSAFIQGDDFSSAGGGGGIGNASMALNDGNGGNAGATVGFANTTGGQGGGGGINSNGGTGGSVTSALVPAIAGGGGGGGGLYSTGGNGSTTTTGSVGGGTSFNGQNYGGGGGGANKQGGKGGNSCTPSSSQPGGGGGATGGTCPSGGGGGTGGSQGGGGGGGGNNQGGGGGGTGGGGGGSSNGAGGSGGWGGGGGGFRGGGGFGGGGGGTTQFGGNPAGTGGFGGGGGGSGYRFSLGGEAGFGGGTGGAAGSSGYRQSTQAVGGGWGYQSGGGGAAFGGAIFINTGSLTLQNGSINLPMNAVVGGAGGSGGTVGGSGAAAGENIFSLTDINLNPTVSSTISGSIADGALNSVPATGFSTPGSGPGIQVLKSGAGIATLQGINTYSGGTQISQGVLSIVAAEGLGIGGVTFTGNSTLQFGSSTSYGFSTVTLNPGITGTFDTQAFTATVSTQITGTGALSKISSGTLVVSNASNNYSGGTTITGGVVSTNTTALGSGTINIGAAGTLQGTGTFALSNAVTVAGGSTVDVTNGNVVTLSGLVTGVGGSLTKTSAGTLILSNSGNSYNSGTTITGGILSTNTTALGSGTINIGAVGTLQGTGSFTLSNAMTVAAGSTIDITSSNAVILSGAITGVGGSLTKTSTGTLTLTNNGNTYNGGTTISAGTLAVSGMGNLAATGAVAVASGAVFDLTGSLLPNITIGDFSGAGTTNLGPVNTTFTFGSGAAKAYSGVINGAGDLVVTNSTSETLSGINTYTGGTTINVGSTIFLVGSGVLGNGGLVTLNGTLDVSGISASSTTLGNITGSGTLNIASKILDVGDASSPAAFSGMITGSGGSVVKINAGTFTLSGMNTYDGGTTIQAGTLAITGTGTLASGGFVTVDSMATFDLTGSMQPNLTIGDYSGAGTTKLGSGTLTFGTMNSEMYSGQITGAGGLIKQGSGTQTLSNVTNTYMGGTTITAGILSTNTTALGSGTINIGAVGTLQGTGSFTLSNAMTVAAGSTIDITSSNAVILSGAITGVGGSLTKTSTGTLTLTNNGNTYNGGTAISAGTLAVSGMGNLAATGAVAVASGAVFDLTGSLLPNITIGDFSGAGTTHLGSGTLTFGTANPESYSGQITGAGGLIKQGGGTQILSNMTNTYMGGTTINGGVLSINTTALGSGTINIGAVGTLQGTGNFTLSNVVTVAFGSTIDVTSGNAITLSGVITGAGGSITKTDTGTLILTNAGNTYSGGTTITGGVLSTNTTALGTGTINIGAAGTLKGTGNFTLSNAMTVANGSTVDVTTGNAMTLSGMITGAGGSVTKTDTGTLILSNAGNTYSGGTTITAGTLSTNTTALGTGTISIGAAGTLKGTGNFTLSNAVAVANGSTVDVTTGNAMTLSGMITGVGGSITKTDTGTLILSNAGNTYSGGTTITAGTLSTNTTALGTGTISIGALGILQGTGNFTLTNAVTVANGSKVDVTAGNAMTLSGMISGAGGSITKTDTGTLVLSNAGNIYSGGTTITAGTLSTNTTALDTGTINIGAAGTLQGTGNFTLSNAVTVALGSTVDVTAGNAMTLSGNVTGVGGSITKTSTGTLILTGSGNSYDAGTTIQGGTVSLEGAGILSPVGTVDVGAGAFFDINLGQSVQIIGDLTGGGTVDLGSNQLRFGNSNGVVPFTGVIQGAGSILKKKFGTAVLSNTNMYLGNTIVYAGTLSISGAGSIATSSAVLINQGATFDISSSAGSQTIQDLSGLPGSVINLGANNLTFGTNANTTFSGVIEGTGSITKQNSGTVVLTGQSTYSGGTFLKGGALDIFRNLALGASGTNLFVQNTSSLILENFATMNHPIVMDPGTTLTIHTDFTPNISSVISETGASGSINKTGSGKLTLSGINTYTGLTSVTAGILAINGSILKDLHVFTGSTLQGTGTIGGNVTVDSGATIKPGNSIGTLTINGNLQLSAGSDTYIELAPAITSSITVGGTANLAGQLTIFADTGVYPDFGTYTILTGMPVMGMFDPTVNFLGQDLGPVQVNYFPTFVQLQLGNAPPPPPPPSFNCHFETALLEKNKNAIHLADYLNQFSTDPNLGPIICYLSNLPQQNLINALESISPARNAIASFVGQNTMFLISSTVSCRMSEKRLVLRDIQMHIEALLAASSNEMSPKSASFVFASNEPSVESSPDYMEQNRPLNPYVEEETSPSNEAFPYGSSQTFVKKMDRYAFWAEGLGEFIHQDAAHENPSYSSGTGGGLLGCDYYGEQNGLLGAAVCYARSHIQQSDRAGEDSIDYYAANLYGTAYLGDGYIELGLAGALNKFYTKRHVRYPGFKAKAQSSHWGWQIVPHLAAGYDFNFDWGTIEPFASFDYDLLSQQAFSEHGAGIWNMHQDHTWSGLLRSEVGLHAYEVWTTNIGDFVLRETLSYVNKEPFNVGAISANLVGFPGLFSVNSFQNNQSFISPGVQLFYRAKNGGFASIFYMGEFQSGSGKYMSNNILLKAGLFF